MARHEADREDLIREATALRERVEMRISGESEPVVAGFRDDGRLSLYFGADPAFHFDAGGRLRRAYVDGDLYRSQGTTLSRLHRERSADETVLARRDLDREALQVFLDALRSRILALLSALESQQIEVLREVPDKANVVARLIERLPAACQGQLAPALKK